MGMSFDVSDLRKMVEIAESRGHNEISIFDNMQVLSRKTEDGYWEEIKIN